jgi:GTP-binding protein
LVDTAGIRRRARVHDGVEAASVIRSIRSIPGAEVVVLMCDASEGIAEQDARLLGLCVEKKRAIIVALNKMDLLSKRQQAEAHEKAKTALHFAPWAPVLSLSAKSGQGVPELMSEVLTAVAAFRKRVSTAELNRFFKQVLERHAPPTRSGRAPRIYYVTQAKAAPPVFVAMSNAPEHIAASYRRFVQNQIRKTFQFHAVPLIVEYRKRTRNRE